MSDPSRPPLCSASRSRRRPSWARRLAIVAGALFAFALFAAAALRGWGALRFAQVARTFPAAPAPTPSGTVLRLPAVHPEKDVRKARAALQKKPLPDWKREDATAATALLAPHRGPIEAATRALTAGPVTLEDAPGTVLGVHHLCQWIDLGSRLHAAAGDLPAAVREAEALTRLVDAIERHPGVLAERVAAGMESLQLRLVRDLGDLVTAEDLRARLVATIRSSDPAEVQRAALLGEARLLLRPRHGAAAGVPWWWPSGHLALAGWVDLHLAAYDGRAPLVSAFEVRLAEAVGPIGMPRRAGGVPDVQAEASPARRKLVEQRGAVKKALQP